MHAPPVYFNIIISKALTRTIGEAAHHAGIDDVTYCNEVERGNFRLHPKGPYGISKGCIVIDKPDEFHHLRNVLRSLKPVPVRGGALNAYAKLVVR